jgi:hypothetical protein
MNAAQQPTLVRLTFWIASDALEEWTAVYQKDILNLLEQHQFTPSKAAARPLIEGVFSRPFAFEDAATALECQYALESYPSWERLIQRLSQRFGKPENGIGCRYRLGIYQTPAGPGRTLEAGLGIRQARWYTLNGQDGRPSTTIRAILQDRQGYLWFGTDSGGVCRFDGAQFITFSSADGLAGNTVFSVAEDHQGRLWFGTRDGSISRYDG